MTLDVRPLLIVFYFAALESSPSLAGDPFTSHHLGMTYQFCRFIHAVGLYYKMDTCMALCDVNIKTSRYKA